MSQGGSSENQLCSTDLLNVTARANRHVLMLIHIHTHLFWMIYTNSMIFIDLVVQTVLFLQRDSLSTASFPKAICARARMLDVDYVCECVPEMSTQTFFIDENNNNNSGRKQRQNKYYGNVYLWGLVK